MSMRAFIVVSVRNQSDITATLKQLVALLTPYVEGAGLIYGDADVLLQVAVDTPEQLADVVVTRLRSHREVQASRTYLVIHNFEYFPPLPKDYPGPVITASASSADASPG